MKNEDKLQGGTVSPESIVEPLKKAAPDCLPPVEVAGKAKAVGITKANLDVFSTVILGILAGAFIGLGAMLCTMITTNTGLGFGMTKLIGGLVFCLGLILVVLAGAELFTGNNLLVMAWLSGKISFGKVLRNWGLVYFANFAGALSLVALMFYTVQWGLSGNAVGANAIQIANAKVNLSFAAALTRGILCNALVCLAIWLCFSARTVIDKIVAIVFPITAFVAAGFEHSVANMYFIPMGIVLANQPAVVQAAGLTSSNVANLNVIGLVNNLIPVTIGNIIGGGLFVGAVYWAAYLRKDQANMGEAVKHWLSTMVPAFRHTRTEELAEVADGSKAALREALAKSLLARHTKSEAIAAESYKGSGALREVLAKAVLAKASGDDTFFKRLAEKPDEVLKGYDLSPEEKAALSSGNTEWLESRVGALNDPLGAWVTLRLAKTSGDKN